MTTLKDVSSPLPRAPEHLSAGRRGLWGLLVAEWRLETHELEVLRLACEALDRGEAARVMVEREGLTVEGRHGPRTHPAVAVERDSRLAAARLLKQLGLEAPPPPVDPMALRPRLRRG